MPESTVVTEAKVKPVLKYAGSKFHTETAKTVAALYDLYSDEYTWVEPFCGALGMTLVVKPAKALMFDKSPEIIGLHNWIKDGGVWVGLPSEVTQDEYYILRNEFNSLQMDYAVDPSKVNKDRMFSLMIWLNRASHNGLWRVNNGGKFNTPMGRKASGELYQIGEPALSDLNRIYNAYDWQFQCCDFAAVDFSGIEKPWIYCDPPYFGKFSTYAVGGFGWADHVRLTEWTAPLSCPVVISNTHCDELETLYRDNGFETSTIVINFKFNSSSDFKIPIDEIFAQRNLF